MGDGSQIHLSRRRLIQLGGGATAALYLPNLSSAAFAAGVPDLLKRSLYAPLVGRSFGSGAGNLTLSAVSDLARAKSEPAFAGRDDAFALSFTGPAGTVLQQRIRSPNNDPPARSMSSSPPSKRPAPTRATRSSSTARSRSAPRSRRAPEPLELSQRPGLARAEVPPAGVTVAAPGSAGNPPKPKPKLVEFASVARRGHALAVDVRIARGHGIVSVSVSLVRNGNVYGRASSRLRGRRALRLNLRRLRRLAPATTSSASRRPTPAAAARSARARSRCARFPAWPGTS